MIAPLCAAEAWSGPAPGTTTVMPGEDLKHEQYPEPERTLLPEERDAGSDDPDAQAKAILDDARERAAITRDTPGVERRRSEDTVDVSETGSPSPSAPPAEQ